MKSQLLNIFKFLIGWPLSVIALYFIYRTFSTQITDFSPLSRLNWGALLTGVVCFIGYYFLRSLIWLKLLQFLGHQIPFRDSNFLWLFAQLKRYIPGNIWSYLGLAVTYTERNVPKKDIAYAVWIESELVIIATFLLSLFAVPFVLQHFISLSWPTSSTTFVIVILFITGAILYLFLGKWLRKYTGRGASMLHHIFSKFSPQENLLLLLLTLASYVCYSLGYYFAISSVAPLDPQHILTFAGIFTFSLVAGYLSIITPTGLGVREGFIALGLAKFIPLGLAGFAAIFSRIIIVFAELLTIMLAYAWYKAGTRVKRGEKFVAEQTHEVFLSICVVLYTIYFTLISFLRYTEYYTGRFDLGNMAQTVWNTFHGRIFLLTDPNGTEIVSRLAFHADFILVLLSPFYLLWQDPRTLLLIQTVVIAAGAFFVYGIARHLLNDKTIAVVIAISYLLNPSVERANLYDFHAVVLATTFLLGAVYYLLKKRYGLLLLCAVLAALTKEQLWFIIALFGPILFFGQKKRLLGGIVFFLALGIFYYLVWHAIPQVAGSHGHFALSYFSDGGDSPTDIIKSIVFSPIDSLQTAFAPDRLQYYEKLLLPVGFLPLLYPFWLIMAAPDLVLNIFSDRSQLQQIYYQYTAAISPFLYVSTIYGVSMLRKYVPRVPLPVYTGYLLLAALISAYLYGPLPGSKEPNLAMITKPLPERGAVDRELSRIPQAASVAASNNLASHLSHRERIYVIPHGVGQADFVALFKPRNNTNDKDSQTLEQMRSNPFYDAYYENSQVVLYKKNHE